MLTVMLTVCTERRIRQLLLTVRNSAVVLDMTAGVGPGSRGWGLGHLSEPLESFKQFHPSLPLHIHVVHVKFYL